MRNRPHKVLGVIGIKIFGIVILLVAGFFVATFIFNPRNQEGQYLADHSAPGDFDQLVLVSGTAQYITRDPRIVTSFWVAASRAHMAKIWQGAIMNKGATLVFVSNSRKECYFLPYSEVRTEDDFGPELAQMLRTFKKRTRPVYNWDLPYLRYPSK